jgi:hypothetical protein
MRFFLSHRIFNVGPDSLLQVATRFFERMPVHCNVQIKAESLPP